MQTLPCEITKPSYFAPQSNKASGLKNYKSNVDFTLQNKSNAYFAPQNHREVVLGATITTERYIFFFLFYNEFHFRYVYNQWKLFKEKIFCVMVPLNKVS